MVTRDALKNGILTYIDSEIIPHLPPHGKWGVGAMIVLLTPKFDEVFQVVIDNPFVKSLGVVDEYGNIDSDTLIDALYQSSNKYGKMSVSIPVLGTLSFSGDDVMKLKNYIH